MTSKTAALGRSGVISIHHFFLGKPMASSFSRSSPFSSLVLWVWGIRELRAIRKKGPCWAPLWGLLQSSPNWWWCSCCKVDFVHIHCVQTVLDWVSASNTMRQCRASCFQPQESVPLIRFLLYRSIFFRHKMCILQFHRYEPGIHCHKSACIYLGKFQRNLTNMRQHRWRLARPLWITSF
jgi:hypothetical protein